MRAFQPLASQHQEAGESPAGASGLGRGYLLAFLGHDLLHPGLFLSGTHHVEKACSVPGLVLGQPGAAADEREGILNDNFPVVCPFGVFKVYGQGYPSLLLEHLLNLAEQGEKNLPS